MRAQGRFKAVAALIVATAALAVPDAHAGIKCWTNKEGVRECGNAVPPEYAQEGHQEVNKQGVTVKSQQRAKTQEELDAERAERERAEREEIERKRLAREQEAKDRVLLHTFTSEEDLVLARDGKLGAIDSRIKHTEQVIVKLETSLEQLQGEAAGLERSGKKVPEKLRERINDVRKSIDENEESILRRHKEKEELAAQFDQDLARYRELHSVSN